MSTASLELLKGSKQTAVAEELGSGAEEAVGAEVKAEGEAELAKLTGKQIEDLVAKNGVETPSNWAKMKVEEKRAWLEANFEVQTDAGETANTVMIEAPAAPAKTSKSKKGKSSGTEVSTEVAKIVHGEIVSDDLIVDIVHTVENLKEKEARDLVIQLREGAEFTFFKLGGVLSIIQANGWFEPYGSFRDYVEKEHGINYRRAMYWIAIYNGIVESGVPWSKVKHLGWTKLKEIVPVLTTENVNHWVKIAEQQTTLQLIETVKNSQKKNEIEGGGAEQQAKTVTTKTFKVHDDQKATIEAAIEKAKGVSQTSADTVALEYICLDYLNGVSSKVVDVDVKAVFKAKLEKHQGDAEEALKEIFAALETVFPKVNLTVEIED